MLAYILAVVVGTGSVGLYLAAFFLPAVHRKQDFIWSGVGLFYALFLWLYAHQVTGGILVGQTASVVLLGWLTWQIFNLRRQVEPLSQQIPIPNGVVNRSNPKAAKSTAKPPATVPDASTPLANARVPAKAATTTDRVTKTTSNPASTAAKSTSPVTPVGTEAPPRERKASPASVSEASSQQNRISQPASTPPVSTPSNLDPVKATPVERKTAPAPVGGKPAPQENRISTPASTPPVPTPSNLDPAKTAPVADRSSQPASTPPVATPSNLNPAKTAPVERKTTPAPVGGKPAPQENRTSQSVSIPTTIPPVAPPPPSNLDSVRARSGEDKTTPTAIGGAATQENRSSQPAIAAIPASPQSLLDELEEDLAWITLEVKPAPAPPLGTPAQPPAAKIPPPPQPKVVPEVVPDRNIPTDTIQTTAKIDAEDGK